MGRHIAPRDVISNDTYVAIVAAARCADVAFLERVAAVFLVVNEEILVDVAAFLGIVTAVATLGRLSRS